MSKDVSSSRRSFLRRSALLAAPVAAGAPAFALAATDGTKARLQRLEDETAIRSLHQRWLRKINTGERTAALGEGVRRVTTDHAEPDVIDVAADGTSAKGRFHCTLERELVLDEDSTLAGMARAQGTGFVRRSERGVLEVRYVKTADGWSIENATFG